MLSATHRKLKFRIFEVQKRLQIWHQSYLFSKIIYNYNIGLKLHVHIRGVSYYAPMNLVF